MKSLVLLLAMSLSLTAFAQTSSNAAQSKQLLNLLLQNPSAKLVNKTAASPFKTVSDVLTDVLASTSTVDGSAVPVATNSQCVNKTPRGLLGASLQSCTLSITVTQKDGADTFEASYVLAFEVSTPVVPHPAPKLIGPVTLTLAD